MAAKPFRRKTRQRQILLEQLRKLTSHPTATELYHLVRQRLPNLSLGTVYRNLDLLARAGMIQKLDWSDAEARFDGNICHHDHLRCVRCGRVDDLGGGPLEPAPEGRLDFHGYEVLGHRLEFFGICPRCRQQPATNTSKTNKGETDHA